MFKTRKGLILATCILAASVSPASASLMKFNFTVGGFTDTCSDPAFLDSVNNDPLYGSLSICDSGITNDVPTTITGSFVGEDLNGDGYISSFLTPDIFSASNPDQQLLVDAGFGVFDSFGNFVGANEVRWASFTLSGTFIEGVEGYLDDPLITHTVTHDIDNPPPPVVGSTLPTNTFFALNYNVNSPGILGDDEFETLFMGIATINFGLGQLLTSPFGIPTITETMLTNSGSLSSCTNGAPCGILHSLAPDLTVPSVQRTASLARVTQVPEPATFLLFSSALLGIAGFRLRNRKSVN
ncbi:PEP-CTERM sorting domain-containing protein [Arsukibacterium sp.]|uniref:PEP-CTERM sorting domain-containing protein n=1 Tax=Arsukibacterium sp. TaxID=1977258 RepID=UPI003568657C